MADMDVAAAYYEEHQALTKPINDTIARGDSAIQMFYEGTSIFVTGATGFLGKQLIEKLLRSCNIKRVYILIRVKKGIPVKERLFHWLQDPVTEFRNILISVRTALQKEDIYWGTLTDICSAMRQVYEELKKYKPEFAEKVIPIEGDVAELQLGISEEDRITLTQEVEIIFHAAAITRFDEHLRTATLINVRGTKEVLTLAKSCRNLKSFVYVSTAFCHATESRIGKETLEQFYPCSVPPETMIQIAETIDGEKIKTLTADLIRDWPNTYTFTKALGEEVVRVMGEGLPVCIVRPPGVISSFSEPVPGWTETKNIFGTSGLTFGVLMGVIHVTYNSDVELPVVPVDFVNNAVIASAWDTVQRVPKDIKIYNIRLDIKHTWGMTKHFLRCSETRSFSSPRFLSYACCVDTSNKFIFWILTWLFHYIPGYIVDTVCFVFSIKMPNGIPSVVKIYEKIYRFSLAYSHFLLNAWDFPNGNTKDMFSRLSQSDKIIFNFNTADIDWKRLILIWCLSIRLFVLKDGLKDSAYGYKKQRLLMIVTYLYLSLYFIVPYNVLSYVIKFIF